MSSAPPALSPGSRRTTTSDMVSLASPEPGRPMISKVESVGSCVRRIADEVADAIIVRPQLVVEALGPRLDGLGFQLHATTIRRRAAWWLVGQWLTGFAVDALSGDATLEDAEEWFYGIAGPNLPRLAPGQSMEEVSRLASSEDVWALLPYLLDPLAPGTRRHVLSSDAQAADRAARKQGGVFYTPADVADWMTQSSAPAHAGWSCLDPACGSGVFLRAALTRSGSTARVFGIDLDPAAAEMAAFIVLSSTIGEWEDSPWCGWQSARSRLATLDALLLEAGTELNDVEQRVRVRRIEALEHGLRHGEVLPPAAAGRSHTAVGSLFPQLEAGVEVLLSNPPYAALGDDPRGNAWAARFESFAGRSPTAASNIYTAFVELAWCLTKPGTGRASVVVPLSIAFHQARQYAALRNAMAACPGRWECAFFDRAPDALFGDDVKTRNAVLTYSAASSGMAVTGLLRWTSRSRRSFFADISPVDVDTAIEHGIPRVSTPEEAALLRALRTRAGTLAHDVVRSERVPATKEMADGWPDAVFVGPTAYNWFNCLRDLNPCIDAGHEGSAGFHALRFEDSRMADAAYALVASRLSYWLWRAEGDAFHVSRSFITRLPLRLGRLTDDALDELADLGRQLWSQSVKGPVVAVNRQRRTVAYPATGDDDKLLQVDRALAQALQLVDEITAVDLAAWYRTLVVVDDCDQRRNQMPSLRRVEC